MTVNGFLLYTARRFASLDLTKVKVAVPSENGIIVLVLQPPTNRYFRIEKNSSSEFLCS